MYIYNIYDIYIYICIYICIYIHIYIKNKTLISPRVLDFYLVLPCFFLFDIYLYILVYISIVYI